MCCLYRYIYAPYQILKWSGIKGPTPIPFFGNYFQIQKQVNHYNIYFSGQLAGIIITSLTMLPTFISLIPPPQLSLSSFHGYCAIVYCVCFVFFFCPILYPKLLHRFVEHAQQLYVHVLWTYQNMRHGQSSEVHLSPVRTHICYTVVATDAHAPKDFQEDTCIEFRKKCNIIYYSASEVSAFSVHVN